MKTSEFPSYMFPQKDKPDTTKQFLREEERATRLPAL